MLGSNVHMCVTFILISYKGLMKRISLTSEFCILYFLYGLCGTYFIFIYFKNIGYILGGKFVNKNVPKCFLALYRTSSCLFYWPKAVLGPAVHY